MNRASGFYPLGWEFESLQSHHQQPNQVIKMFYYEYNQDYQTVVQYKLINDQKIVLSSMQVPYEDFSKLELLLWLTSMDKVLEVQQEN
jgi:hypothetical protein